MASNLYIDSHQLILLLDPVYFATNALPAASCIGVCALHYSTSSPTLSVYSYAIIIIIKDGVERLMLLQ